MCGGGSPHRARPGSHSLPRTSPLRRPVSAVPRSPPKPFSVVCPEQTTERPPHSPSSRKFPILSLLHSSCCSQGLRSFPVLPFTCLDISSSPVRPPQPTPLPPSLPGIRPATCSALLGSRPREAGTTVLLGGGGTVSVLLLKLWEKLSIPGKVGCAGLMSSFRAWSGAGFGSKY